ncbi:MAG: hypothetical protein Q4D43_05380 [Clostridia bacterium]|nr:hypothetical protein [Clostridia bacterium]
MAYVRPIRSGMVVAADKVAKFNAQKTSNIEREERKKLIATFHANNNKKTK